MPESPATPELNHIKNTLESLTKGHFIEWCDKSYTRIDVLTIKALQKLWFGYECAKTTDSINIIKPGDVVPIMREVVEIKQGNVYFKSDDGSIAYGRYQDIRDGINGKINSGCLYEEVENTKN